MNRSRWSLFIAAVFVVSMAALSDVAFAQQGGAAPSRTILSKNDLSVPGREGLLVVTQLPAGSREPNHIHDADLYAYVQEGNVMFHVDGQPDQNLQPGGFIFIPAQKVHYASNEKGTATVKMLVTFFAEKGKPLTTPVK